PHQRVNGGCQLRLGEATHLGDHLTEMLQFAVERLDGMVAQRGRHYLLRCQPIPTGSALSLCSRLARPGSPGTLSAPLPAWRQDAGASKTFMRSMTVYYDTLVTFV